MRRLCRSSGKPLRLRSAREVGRPAVPTSCLRGHDGAIEVEGISVGRRIARPVAVDAIISGAAERSAAKINIENTYCVVI